ncbi:unnamed protein product, partial [Tuber aestivum]
SPSTTSYYSFHTQYIVLVKSLGVQLFQVVMPAIPRSPIKTLLSQFNRRDYPENSGGHDSDGSSPVAIVGIVIAALTLLVGIMSLLSPRFRRWLSRLLPSRFANPYNTLQQVPRATLPGLEPAVP